MSKEYIKLTDMESDKEVFVFATQGQALRIKRVVGKELGYDANDYQQAFAFVAMNPKAIGFKPDEFDRQMIEFYDNWTMDGSRIYKEEEVAELGGEVISSRVVDPTQVVSSVSPITPTNPSETCSSPSDAKDRGQSS
jgi:hypothetical protein